MGASYNLLIITQNSHFSKCCLWLEYNVLPPWYSCKEHVWLLAVYHYFGPKELILGNCPLGLDWIWTAFLLKVSTVCHDVPSQQKISFLSACIKLIMTFQEAQLNIRGCLALFFWPYKWNMLSMCSYLAQFQYVQTYQHNAFVCATLVHWKQIASRALRHYILK